MTEFPVEFPAEVAPGAPQEETVRFRLDLSDGTRLATYEAPSWSELFTNNGPWVRTSTGQLVNPLHVMRIVAQ